MDKNNDQIPTGRDIANKYRYPVAEPIMPVVRDTSGRSIDISNPPLPNLDPNAAYEQSKKVIPALSERIKNKVRSSYYDDSLSYSPIRDLLANGIRKGMFDVSGPKISLDKSRFRLSDGRWISMYDDYVEGVDNDTRLANQQGTGEKLLRGLGKFAYKTALYGIGGVIQPFYGIYEGVTKGKFDAVFNNDFTRWLDDMDKRGDYKLAHYYDKEERDMGFLRSLGTANFWTNDFLSGLSFTAGAMLSSAVFSGAGLMNLSRTGARAGAILAGMGKAASNTKKAFGAYLRGARIGQRVGKGLDVATFLGTSTAWEASVEAKGMMMEAEENFRKAYRNTYGKEVPYGELMRFRADNADAANAVFAANIAVLSLSNIAMFGDMFGMDLGVDKYIKRNIFGIGAERMDNGTLRAITPKRWQKVAGNTFNIIKRPVSEGLYEEGLQGVASKSAEDWVESRYNPMAIRQNIGYMEAIKNGFKETYGSSQGWKEIGIGMIIGSVMGGKSIGGIREWSQDRAANEGMVEAYNANASGLTSASIQAIRGSMTLNAQLSGLRSVLRAEGSEVDNSDADNRIIDKNFSDAVFNRLRYDSEMGMLDDTKENFRTVVESIPNSDIAGDMNMTDDQVNDYKNKLVDEFNRKVDNFVKANRFADSLTEGMSNRSFNAYISNMAYNGLDAKDNMDDIAKQLNKIYKSEIGNALDVYSHLNPDTHKSLEQLTKLTNRINDIEKRILRLQQGVMSAEEMDSQKKALARENDLLLKLTEKRADLERRLSTMVNSEVDISKLALDSDETEITASDLMAAHETITNFENAVSTRGVENYKEAMGLLMEYRNNLVAYKNMNEALSRMRDRRFIRSQEKGFMKILSNLWDKTYKEDDSKYNPSNTDNPDADALYANDQAIDKAYSDGLIGEDEAFMFKTYNHMIARATENEIGRDTDNVVENVPDDEDLVYPGSDRLNDIAIKIWNGNDDILSPREKTIYDNNKDHIDTIVRSFGDNPITRLNKAKARIDRLRSDGDFTERIRETIDDIIDTNINGLDQQEVRDAIGEYDDLMNAKDSGEDIDQDKLDKVIDVIENFSDDPLLQFVEWSRLYDNGGTVVKDYDGSIPMDDVLTESEPGTSTGRTEANAAQNPVVLMATIKEYGDVNYYEVGGMRLDRFMAEVDMDRSETEDNDGNRIVTFTNEMGDTFTVIESKDHARWRISEDEVEAFEDATGVILGRQTSLSTSNWFVVYRKGPNGSVYPYYTGDKFGSKQESVDQEAIANLHKESSVNFRVDMGDPYTKGLYDEYNRLNAIDSNSEETKAAFGKLRDNMVIKVIDGDGRFVSVVKANDDNPKKSVTDLRTEARRMYMDNIGSTASELDMPFVGTVTSVLPGRPNFNIRDVDGTLMVSDIDFTDKTVDKVVSVGYIENGKVEMKDNIRYDTFPFCTAIMRDKYGDYKDHRVPVVAIRLDNGKNYLYPVSLKNHELSSFVSDVKSMANAILSGLDGGVSIDMIMDLNNAIARSDLDTKSYMIPLIGDVQVIKDKLDKVMRAVDDMPMTSDVRGWIGDSRTKEDILLNDVTINVDLNNDPFIAPKFRMSIKRKVMSLDEVEVSTPNIPDVFQTGVSPTMAAEDQALASKGNLRSGENEVRDPC